MARKKKRRREQEKKKERERERSRWRRWPDKKKYFDRKQRVNNVGENMNK